MDDRKLGEILIQALREEVRQIASEQLEPIREELSEIRTQLDILNNTLRPMSGDTSIETASVNPPTHEPNPTVIDDDVKAVNDSANADLDNTWSKALMLIQAQTKEQQFDTWFGDSRVDRYDAVTETAFVTTNSEFTRMWLQNLYTNLVESAFVAVTDRKWKVEFVYTPNEVADAEP